MKVFNLIFCALFVFFAALQYNDPDPYVWMPIYLYSAFLCYQASQKQFYPKAYFLGLLIYGAYAIYLLFDKTGVIDWARDHHAESMVQTMKAEKPWIEESREFFGLVILMVVISINWGYMKRLRKTKGR
ncbi:transmembrane 220 family protein [Mucilaginibacter glaciei]|uniref:Transmembrane 220 family protein n=1 Tax=Mucilaginibacter glaciei TaxID=2772109 RepID=A0A926S108_9SPHI|nr:transmembrane 220 family protein [Mucilaginibacter glaciei]MBD1392573.1 transmembrane 220 family protein [Mucilaginibacter glaciei]